MEKRICSLPPRHYAILFLHPLGPEILLLYPRFHLLPQILRSRNLPLLSRLPFFPGPRAKVRGTKPL